MKLNINQEAVVNFLKVILQSWKNTNDISSPSHNDYMKEILDILVSEDILSDFESSNIEKSLKDILASIRNTTYPL